MRILISTIVLFTVCFHTKAQNYTSYFTGSAADLTTTPIGGVCLMGGATESDEAMQWFLQRANGGDVLVIRASGSNGYNNYLYSELGVVVNSVESIVFHNSTASQDPYVHQRIQRAEAIWIAGGDQWNNVNYWRNTPVDSLINEAITERNIVIGGTSAGMAILGGIYFTAQNGTVTSSAALSDPYGNNVTISSDPFIQVPGIANVITDSHYDDPDRRGRHTVFLARAIVDMEIEDAIGIAAEEYTAVCIAEDGIAYVYGSWPQYEDHAWFIQANCMTTGVPEILQSGTPLTWDHDQSAVKACKVPGTTIGEFTFDLNDRETTIGGSWENWYVQNGTLYNTTGAAGPDCTTAVNDHREADGAMLFLDQSTGRYGLIYDHVANVGIMDMQGRMISERHHIAGTTWFEIPATTPHILLLANEHGRQLFRLIPQ